MEGPWLRIGPARAARLAGRAAAAALLVLAALQARAEPFLFVENSHDGTVSVVQLPRHEVVRTFRVGGHLDDVKASRDGSVLYVNRLEVPEDGFTRSSGELLALDSRSGRILWRVRLPGIPQHFVVSPDDRTLFVPLFDRMHLAIVDVPTKKIAGFLDAPLGGHGTRLAADGRRLYLGSMAFDALVVYDLEERRELRSIPMSDAVRPFAISADESTAYVQLSRLHGFEVVDLESGRVRQRVALPGLPADAELPRRFPYTYNHGLELSPDGRYLLANGSVVDQVAVYRTPTLDLAATIPVGDDPNWIVFGPEGRHAYVTNRGSDDLSVISLQELREVKRVPLGEYPQRAVVVDVPSPRTPSAPAPSSPR